jgi:hypothetical protein
MAGGEAWILEVNRGDGESSGNFYSLHNIPYMTFIYNISFSRPPAFTHLDRPHSILSTPVEQASSLFALGLFTAPHAELIHKIDHTLPVDGSQSEK